jgi:hypothetical protein
MDLQTRVDNYLAQNGSESRLTPRQMRRLDKKSHKQAKARRRLHMVNAEETVLDRIDALRSANACPLVTCAASGDEPCRTASGKPAKTHKGRGE